LYFLNSFVFSDVTPVNTGIRQGESLSPFIFNLVMDKITESLKPMNGYKMGNQDFNILCYADELS
ncbi:hypothetical protein M0802_017018, partial [Mischocyttarus mexicanus]